jgi:hypothetical protein
MRSMKLQLEAAFRSQFASNEQCDGVRGNAFQADWAKPLQICGLPGEAGFPTHWRHLSIWLDRV